MATGDIINVANNADGWSVTITIEGFGTGYVSGNVTYDYGLGVNNDPTNATVKLSIDSTGFSATGSVTAPVDRTVCGTKTVRKPYPDEATLQETVVNTNDLEVVVALSDFIYVNDVPVGGIAFTFLEGWATQGGTPTEAIEVSSSTNSSTLAYPKVLGRWDDVAGVMTADRVTGDFNMAVNAAHRFGIAAVKFTATSASNPTGVTETISTSVSEQYTVSQLYRELYKSSAFDLSQFADGEVIDLRFEAFPNIGDAASVLDTDDNTTPLNEVLGFNKSVIVCDKADDSTLYAYVDGTGPDPGTVSATLATAEADPFLTIGQAVNAGANVIYLKTGTHLAVGARPFPNVVTSEWVKVLPHPTLGSKSTSIVQFDTEKRYGCERMMFEDLTVKIIADAWMDGQSVGNYIRFKDCTFDSSGFAGTPLAGPGFNSDGCYFQGCDGDLSPTNWQLATFSSSRAGYVYEGCELFEEAGVSSNNIMRGVRTTIGCRIDGPLSVTYDDDSFNPLPSHDGCMFSWNYFTNANIQNSKVLNFAGIQKAVTIGFAIINNVIECTDASETTTLAAIGSGASTQIYNNILLHNNTFWGEKTNLAYNEVSPADRLNWSQKGNIFSEWNNKGDVFSSDGTLIGGWPVKYNVGTLSCVYKQSQEAATRGEFDGILVDFGGDPVFVIDASSEGTDLGDGDYHLQETSDAIGLAQEIFTPFDLDGTARFIGGAAGAYEFVTEPPSTGFGLRPRYGGGSHRPRYNGQGRY